MDTRERGNPAVARPQQIGGGLSRTGTRLSAQNPGRGLGCAVIVRQSPSLAAIVVLDGGAFERSVERESTGQQQVHFFPRAGGRAPLVACEANR